MKTTTQKSKEIDDIFSKGKGTNKKRKAPEPTEEEPPKPTEASPKKSKQTKSATTSTKATSSLLSDDLFAPKADNSSKRRYTEEGYPIYQIEELVTNDPNAGMTDECPFDCKCCY
jgi:hypothetical protein